MDTEFMMLKTRDLLNKVLSKWNYDSDIDADKFLAMYDGVQLSIKNQDGDTWAKRVISPVELVKDFQETFESFYRDQLKVDVVENMVNDLKKLYTELSNYNFE